MVLNVGGSDKKNQAGQLYAYNLVYIDGYNQSHH